MRVPSACVVLFLAACGPSSFEPDDPTGDGTGGGDDEFEEPPTCAESVPITLNPTEAPPDLLLVVDKSGSMLQPLGSGFEMKWTVMRDALRQIVEGNDLSILFGLSLYPVNDECGAGNVMVDIAPDNAGPIVAALDGVTFPDGATPTHTTLGQARVYFMSRPDNPNGRYVLLATDGEPNCGTFGPDDPTDTETVQAVADLAGLGIKTYVIGFGSGIMTNPQLLQDMAEAGQTMQYYQANSPADLSAALAEISGQVAVPSCTFELGSTPEDPARLAVSFDGTVVPRSPSHATGWDYDPATNSITFYGESCAELQSGVIAEVGVDYGCGGPSVD